MKIFLTGASCGIGLATAHLLTRHGCEVWGTSREASRLPTLPGFHPVVLDLQQPGPLPDVPFDVLINNAGTGLFGPLESLPAEAITAQFQLLFHAPLALAQLVLPGMKQRGRGLIINITSLAAQFPVPYLTPYNAAKAALSSATQSLRMELADTPIRVVEIQPGDIQTGSYNAVRHPVTGPESPRCDRAWEAYRRHIRSAPPPDRVARAIWRVMNSRRPPPIVTVGSLWQSRLGPFLARFGTRRMIEAVHRRSYDC